MRMKTLLAGAVLCACAVAGEAAADSWKDRRGRGYDRGPDVVMVRERDTWRGRDGRHYCRRPNGTTGLIIGGAAGALLGREIDGGRDRTLGTVLGAAGGALLGREVERGNLRCR